MPTIDKKEWRLVGLIIIFFIGLSLFSIFIALHSKPKDTIFIGTQYINRVDTPVYYSWIEQAKQGHFLFKDLFTSEPHPAFIFDIFWLLVGWLAKILSLSSVVAFQVAKFLLIPLAIIVLYIFISYFFVDPQHRKLCLIFMVFAAGLGGVVACINTVAQNYQPQLVPMDVWAPDGFIFFTLYHNAHFIAALILILLIFLLMLLALEKKKWICSFWAGLAALILFQFHPYHLPTIFLVLGAYLIILSIRNKKILWYGWRYYLTLLILSSPSIIYHLWTYKNFWVMQQIIAQNICLTPALWITLLSYGFLLILALIGIWIIIKKKNVGHKELFLITWIVVQFSLIYLPINIQRRFMTGLEVVIVILAIYGLNYLKFLGQKRVKIKKYIIDNKIMLICLFLILFCFSNYFVVSYNSQAFYAFAYDDHIHLNKFLLAAMTWLKNQTPINSTILSSYYNGGLIPAFSLRPVYMGHWDLTARAIVKDQNVHWFFKNNDGDDLKQKFLTQNKINYLFYSNQESTLGSFNPAEKRYLQLVFTNPEVKIYQVIND